MVQSSSRLIPTVPLNLSSLASGQFAYPGVSNPTSSVSNSTALELLVPSHPFGDLHPCRNGRLCGSVPGTYCKLQRDKGFNKSTISRIVNDPKVKKWLARVLVVYPEDESFYRWLRIILHPCKTPRDLKKPKTPKTPKDSKAFKKLKKPKRSKKSNESLYQEWWDFISTD
ncbi:hypothetical protein BGX34_009077 [Mortierella sp. NVP85]|nr:hypothetical protein BGX34_009077 [Mortierella sp. NVP85]